MLGSIVVVGLTLAMMDRVIIVSVFAK